MFAHLKIQSPHLNPPERILLLHFFWPGSRTEEQLLLLPELYAGAPSSPHPQHVPFYYGAAVSPHCATRTPEDAPRQLGGGSTTCPLTISDHLSALRPSCCEQRQSADSRQPASRSQSPSSRPQDFNSGF